MLLSKDKKNNNNYALVDNTFTQLFHFNNKITVN